MQTLPASAPRLRDSWLGRPSAIAATSVRRGTCSPCPLSQLCTPVLRSEHQLTTIASPPRLCSRCLMCCQKALLPILGLLTISALARKSTAASTRALLHKPASNSIRSSREIVIQRFQGRFSRLEAWWERHCCFRAGKRSSHLVARRSHP